MIDKQRLAHNLAEIQQRIADAVSAAGRTASDVTLVVVTKGYPSEALVALYDLGIRDLGESYVVDALQKQADLGKLADIEWHMIGHVQSRKAADVAANFYWIHSVNSLKLASRLSKFAVETNREVQVLLELNVGGEPSKHGFSAGNDASFDDHLSEIEQILQLPNARVRGLMSMAPMTTDSDQARPFFERTRQLRDRLATRFPLVTWEHLSMGMSNDFEAAILEGATMVRIGTAILGSRA